MPDRVITFRVALEGLDEANASTQKFSDTVRGVGASAQQGASGAEALATATDKTSASLTSAGVAATQTAAAVEAVGASAPAVAAVGVAADKAQSGVLNLGGGMRELEGTLRDRLQPSAEAAFAAMQRLSEATTPRALQRGLLDATVATEQFKKAIDDAKAAGENFAGPGGRIVGVVQAMDRDIASATARMGKMRDEMGDIALRANQSGQAFEYLRQAGGGVGGMLNALESSGDKALSTIGKLGIASLGAVGIFAAAKEVGTAFGNALAFVVDKSSQLTEIQQKGALAHQRYADAIRAGEKGLISLGGSMQDLLHAYDLLILAQGRGSRAAQEQAASFAGLKIAGTVFAEIEAKADTMAALLAGAFKKSKQAGLDFALVNQQSLREIEAAYRQHGEVVPAAIRKGIEAVEEYQGRFKRLAEAQAEANKASAEFPKRVAEIGAALQRVREDFQKEADAARASTAAVVASRDEEIRKLREAGLSEEEYLKKKQEILQKTDALIVENAAKEQAARAKEKADLAEIATKYGATGKALAELNQKYLDGQKVKQEVLAADRELASLQDVLGTAVAKTKGQADGASAAMLGLAESLTRVGASVTELVQ